VLALLVACGCTGRVAGRADADAHAFDVGRDEGSDTSGVDLVETITKNDTLDVRADPRPEGPPDVLPEAHPEPAADRPVEPAASEPTPESAGAEPVVADSVEPLFPEVVEPGAPEVVEPGAPEVVEPGAPEVVEPTSVDVAEPSAPEAQEPDPGPAIEVASETPSEVAECVLDADCVDGAAPGLPCRAVACQEGHCVEVTASDGVPCDDGDGCTTADACVAGACRGLPVVCADAGPCSSGACDPSEGCVTHPATGPACDDGSACTAFDACVLGVCLGEPIVCDDGDGCTVDACDPGVGCVVAPATGPACDDADACTTGDVCRTGACEGSPISCDDGDACTADTCDPATGCDHRALNGAPCDDGSACTVEDHCAKGVCVGASLPCTDGNPCTADACDPLEGCVFPPADGAGCNDGNACTDLDRCVDGSCAGEATACDDGNPCTVDGCTFVGGCFHQQPANLPCDDHDACTVDDRCYLGVCRSGLARECNDGNGCTADGCDPAAGCFTEDLAGTPCDDHDACTAGDACQGGACVGAPLACDDQNPCTLDGCDPAVGCTFAPNADPCDDGDPCTSGDVCADGACQPGWDPECLAVDRVVLAGDSWSSGLILPLRDALDARGYEEVTVSWELTSKPGSTVAGWLADSSLMLGLYVALDAEPRADILFFTLSGNDYLGACKSGLGLVGALEWWLTMSKIQLDLQTFVALARAGRPHLRIMLIGYDYLAFDLLQLLGFAFPGFDRIKFNLGLVDLAQRGRSVAASTPDMIYAHNMGLLQYTFGDPLFGYPPGAAPKPGPAPTYDPFPGGWFTHPSPAGFIPDGIHPSYDGFRAIIENSLDQGATTWIEGTP